jgi:hypothetical protein
MNKKITLLSLTLGAAALIAASAISLLPTSLTIVRATPTTRSIQIGKDNGKLTTSTVFYPAAANAYSTATTSSGNPVNFTFDGVCGEDPNGFFRFGEAAYVDEGTSKTVIVAGGHCWNTTPFSSISQILIHMGNESPEFVAKATFTLYYGDTEKPLDSAKSFTETASTAATHTNGQFSYAAFSSSPRYFTLASTSIIYVYSVTVFYTC